MEVSVCALNGTERQEMEAGAGWWWWFVGVMLWAGAMVCWGRDGWWSVMAVSGAWAASQDRLVLVGRMLRMVSQSCFMKSPDGVACVV